MHGQSWLRAEAPASPTAPVLVVDLRRPADLTAARRRLRTEVMSASPAAAAVDEDAVDRLLLAFEELTSNGLRHGDAPVQVTVTVIGDGWLISVTDNAIHRPPTPDFDRDPAMGGLGLHMIARLCEAHGWTVHGARKLVWGLCALTPAPVT